MRAILELFRCAFGHERSDEAWRWRYERGPHGPGAISLAVSPRGRLLAHYGGWPVELVDTEGAAGRTLRAMHVGDTMTAPALRRLGRRATTVLARCMYHHFAEFSDGRVAFDYGFNRGSIRRFYLRQVEGSRMLEAVPYRVLDLEGRTRSRPMPGAGAITTVHVNSGDLVDDAWDAFFARVAPAYGLLVRRDGSYVRTRYLEAPDRQYHVQAAFTGDEVAAWAAFTRDGERLVWGDLLVDPARAGAAAAVLEGTLEEPAMRGVRRVEGWFPARPGWSDEMLTGLGLVPVDEPRGLALIYRPFVEPDIGAALAGRLYYTMGDGDLF